MAEGVETKSQKDFLEANGCINIQGFYCAKPMSAKDIEREYL
jgi:EAL domain-containing protein (putative c-di-GMP-specific phosphodiesterase class I)